MLANGEMMAASNASQKREVSAALGRDPRVVFAVVTTGAADGDDAIADLPGVAVYLEESAGGRDACPTPSTPSAARTAIGGIDVAVLNAMDLEAAGRVLQESELLLDRDPPAREAFEVRASLSYLDFRESEVVFLRERAERPYADTLALKLSQLDELISRLREIRGLTPEAYVTDWKSAYVAERALEIAIGLCIDTARHVLAERRLPRPTTYRETFVIARDAGLLEPGVAESLMRMCGFRNRVAHEGTNLDATVVVRMVESGVEDLARFRDAVSRL